MKPFGRLLDDQIKALIPELREKSHEAEGLRLVVETLVLAIEGIEELEERIKGLEHGGKALARKVRVMQVAMSCPGDMYRQFTWGMEAIREEDDTDTLL